MFQVFLDVPCPPKIIFQDRLNTCWNYFKTGRALSLWGTARHSKYSYYSLVISIHSPESNMFCRAAAITRNCFFDLFARDYRERYLWRPYSLFKMFIQRLPLISHHAFGIAIFNSFKIFCSQEVKDMKARWIWQTLWKQILSPWWGTSCEHRGFIPGGGDVRQTASMINCHTEFVLLVSLKVDSFIFMCHLPSSKTFPAKIAK